MGISETVPSTPFESTSVNQFLRGFHKVEWDARV